MLMEPEKMLGDSDQNCEKFFDKGELRQESDHFNL